MALLFARIMPALTTPRSIISVGFCLLQGNNGCRSAERQRLEHVRSPHARGWAQSLRDLSTELQPSFQVHTLILPAL